MTVEVLKDISGDVFKTLLILSAPMLLASMIVGLAVSFFQAVTQIQEFTLTFVPKIMAVFAVIFVMMPWLIHVMTGFTIRIIDRLPMVVK
ncbi:MAG: flagellar biosynthesis protein FliQ [Nitrospirae bacterium]|nr:flagellar biosynthesis protein FliQ [Nitrospirota bacterium]